MITNATSRLRPTRRATSRKLCQSQLSGGVDTGPFGVGPTATTNSLAGRPRSSAVLLKIYAHCIDGQADAANQRITYALGTQDAGEGPDDEGDVGSEPAA
jgi:hypothetical protein